MMNDPTNAQSRKPRRPVPVRQDGAFGEPNAPYRAKRIAIIGEVHLIRSLGGLQRDKE